MKNDTLVLMMILICLCWFGIFKFSGLAVMHMGESVTYSGRTLVIERVYEDSVVISINEEKDFFKIGDTKTINGVIIHVSGITYFPEQEDRSVELNLDTTTVCGNGNCELGEDSSFCCLDCGCSQDYECENSECVYSPTDKCQTDTDCNDNNALTKDFCFGSPKTCHYQIIKCQSDKDCDDKDSCTKDTCSFNDCVHQPIGNCKYEETTTETSEGEGFFSRLFKKLFNIF